MCLCLLIMLSRLEVTAFDKVFLRMASCRTTDGRLHRHQAGTPFFSPSTPTERECWG